MNGDIHLLNVPIEESVRYRSNFISTAVCELRFPVLLELEEKPPVKFQTALRKEYPFYSKSQIVSVSEQGASSGGCRYLFESRKKDWTVSLKAGSLSLETSKYTEFDDFANRLKGVLDKVGGLLDTDFFTRVGLRYINALPIKDEDVAGWINPVLIASVNEKVLGTLTAFNSEIRGFIDDGRYTFRHGGDPDSIREEVDLKYMLDYDYYSDSVEIKNVFALLKKYHDLNFSFFRWSLGDKAKELLGEGKKKS